MLSLILGCSEPLAPDKSILGYDYFPYAKNQYRVYQTHVILYNLDGSEVVEDYQIKEVVADSEKVDDETSFRLERYRRADESESWVMDSVWTARINTYTAIVVEHNVPIIKLSFPVKENRSWDGNAMNTRYFDEFEMINVGEPYTIDETTYTETIEIEKEYEPDPASLAVRDIRMEVFAKGIGLIYKANTVLQHDFNNPGTILEGIEFTQKLIETGEEQ